MGRTFTVTVDSPSHMLAALPMAAGNDAEHRWLADALAWLKSADPEERTERLKKLTEEVDQHPLAAEYRTRLRRLWSHHSYTRIFTEAGLPNETAFLDELGERLGNVLLPRLLPPDGDLYAVLDNLSLSLEDAGWVASLPPNLSKFWGDLLTPTDESIYTAMRLLAIRASSVGLSSVIMQLNNCERPQDSPFYRLIGAVENLTANPADPPSRASWMQTFAACRSAISQRRAALETSGVTTNLMFRLDLLSALLHRIDTLFLLASDVGRGRGFAVEIVGGFAEHRGLLTLFRSGGTHLARKVVEHTGRSGGHYIAGSSVEWRVMGYGAIGAGCLTAFTALIKFAIGHAPLAPAIAGIAFSINYTFFFVMMQFLHFPLASKMPAMTAAALADALAKHDGADEEINLITAMTRTQFAVTIGNLVGTIPLSLAIDALWRYQFQYPYLPIDYAAKTVHGIHPLLSWSILFAAITGASLWLASLAAGWTTNWMAFRSLPGAIASSRRIREAMGDNMAHRFSRFVKVHLSGIVGYTVLGFLLGFVPVFAKFLGIAYEVRHVTLAAASVAYGWSSLFYNHRLEPLDVVWSVAGIGIVGFFNFATAFLLGLWLAMRSRSINYRSRVQLLRGLWHELTHRPARFFFPKQIESAERAKAVAHGD